jgi:hypothetical protein
VTAAAVTDSIATTVDTTVVVAAAAAVLGSRQYQNKVKNCSKNEHTKKVFLLVMWREVEVVFW